jgi:hypothetical protein
MSGLGIKVFCSSDRFSSCQIIDPVHINLVLRELREEHLLTFQKGRVTFNDFDRLVAIVVFDYLNHDGPLLS